MLCGRKPSVNKVSTVQFDQALVRSNGTCYIQRLSQINWARSLLLVFDELALKTSGRCITESTVRERSSEGSRWLHDKLTLEDFVLVGLMGLSGVMS